MKLHGLFPIPVSYFNFESTLTQEELDFINEQEVVGNNGNTTSKNNYVFNDLRLQRIKDFCDQSIAEYFKEVVVPKEDVSPYITQSWINYTSKGQWHHKHAHPNSVLSGVFYVQAQQGIDKIHFYRDVYKQIQVPADPDSFSPFNSESWWMEATTGQLIIFPSYLSHSVEPVQTDSTRISISFNTFLRGLIGENNTLTELRL
jgi:uncharacterized protein (TIGR02466 family)